jgi:hypothetical protein
VGYNPAYAAELAYRIRIAKLIFGYRDGYHGGPFLGQQSGGDSKKGDVMGRYRPSYLIIKMESGWGGMSVAPSRNDCDFIFGETVHCGCITKLIRRSSKICRKECASHLNHHAKGDEM